MSDAVKLLLIEDDDDHAELFGHYLGSSRLLKCQIQRASVLSEAVSLLNEGDYDVVLSDLNLPDSDSDKTMKTLNAHCQCPYVVITSSEDVELIKRMVRDGASDCVSKEQLFNTAILERSIYYAIERGKVKSELVEREQTFRMLFQNSQQAVAVVDFDGNILEANGAYLDLLGLSLDEIKGGNVLSMTHEDDLEISRSLLADVKREGSMISIKKRVWTSDRELKWVALSAQKVDWFASEAIYSEVLDITDQVRRAEVMKREKESAERANEAKTIFLSNMSHEIRTPLNAILGFTEILQGEVQRDSSLELLKDIKLSGDHLLALIDDVLNLAKIESGKIEIKEKKVILKSFIWDILKSMSAYAMDHQVELQYENSSDIETWVLDPIRCRQILINLISNGIKYNKTGGRLLLSVSVCDEILKIQVRDEGRGLSLEQQERLFIPFDRLGKENLGIVGTGIGLSITKRLVELMGGDIVVSSEVGAGSNFEVHLPQGAVDVTEEDASDQVLNDHEVWTKFKVSSKHEMLVCYVEDNKMSQKLLSKILQKSGVPHQVFDRAEDFVSQVLKGELRPTLILLDINLPGMSGLEAAKQLHALKDDGFALVALSADAMEHQREQAREVGFDEYMTKPLNIPYLLERLQMMCAEDLKSE